ncbi:hypothetical protein BJY04DRAFT_223333 [Aspergillus karnatakaensis]|uniref:uncharacterized protein n=1 Tax=Aspergillus karnatakaensis TaxID=1810916 RepID=UPI003CCDDAA5
MSYVGHQKAFGHETAFSPAVNDLERSISGNPELLNLSQEMFSQSPSLGKGNLTTLLQSLNKSVKSLPTCSSPSTDGLSCPVTDALDPYVSTPAGNKLFTHTEIQTLVGKLLEEWTQLEDNWIQNYQSWDEMVIHEFQSRNRRIHEPDNDDVIDAACDERTDQFLTNVGKDDTLIIKGREYTLRGLLDDGTGSKPQSSQTDQFVNGSVYQGHIPAESYHHFHALFRIDYQVRQGSGEDWVSAIWNVDHRY